MSRAFNSMLSAFQEKILAPGEQKVSDLADKMGDAIDRNINVNRSKGKRVDKREFMRAWDALNTNINKFFAENSRDSMQAMEDELALYGGVDEDDVIGSGANGGGPGGKSGKSEKELKKERDYLNSHIKPHL